MKLVFLGIALTVLFARPLHAAERGKHLFILSGQSNMKGMDPEVSFTPALVKAFGEDHVIVVKDAAGGQSIRRWYKKWKPAEGRAPRSTGDLYDRLMEKVRAAIKDKTIQTVTFIWMQGEQDAHEQHGDVYAASLRGLLEQLSEDLRRKDINYVIGRLSDCGNHDERFPHWMKIREAQMEVGTSYSRGVWVDTDDLNGGENDLHYTREGYKLLGERFAQGAILRIRKGPKKSASSKRKSKER